MCEIAAALNGVTSGDDSFSVAGELSISVDGLNFNKRIG